MAVIQLIQKLDFFLLEKFEDQSHSSMQLHALQTSKADNNIKHLGPTTILI